MLPDEHIEVINWNAGVSKPRIRKILEIAAEIELDLKIADIQQRTGKKPLCRLVGGCAVYFFPHSRIVRRVESPETA
jgi:hypothetical protein